MLSHKIEVDGDLGPVHKSSRTFVNANIPSRNRSLESLAMAMRNALELRCQVQDDDQQNKYMQQKVVPWIDDNEKRFNYAIFFPVRPDEEDYLYYFRGF